MDMRSTRRRKLAGLVAGAAATGAIASAALWNSGAQSSPPRAGRVVGLLDVQQACERIGGRKFVQVRAGVQHLVCEVVRDETSPAVYENLNFDDECSTAWGLANLVARETVTDDADAAAVVVVECLQPT